MRRPRIHDAIAPRRSTPKTDGTMIRRLPKNAAIMRPWSTTVAKFWNRCQVVGRARLGFSASAWSLPAVTITSQKGMPSNSTMRRMATMGWMSREGRNRARPRRAELIALTAPSPFCAGSR